MITDLLPRYKELTQEKGDYTVIRSIPIDGHDVAWIEYSGTIEFDFLELGREGQRFSVHTVKCECDFTEGVGFKIQDGRQIGIWHEPCLYRQVAMHLRHLELRREYLQKYKDDTMAQLTSLYSKAEEVLFDLIEKVKAGEFIGEDGNGASFWGGYFYLQTFAAILDCRPERMWEFARKMTSEKKITLEGAVVQDYREPPPPSWSDCVKIEVDFWTGIARLPRHSHMPQEWQLEVRTPEGELAYDEIPGLPILYSPDFGPDVEDIQEAEGKLRELIESAKEKRQ